ncbi:capsule biosynthesis GfcC family protein [Variovorax sp. UC122_21]|uniref:capsule biosynthesis GfcC family protein n=1 Tax=Variovorax sp. UC122_21 TaxID=3374554 RepID=UPI003757FD9D
MRRLGSANRYDTFERPRHELGRRCARRRTLQHLAAAAAAGDGIPGLSWRVPEERLAQQFLKNTLLVRLEAEARRAPRADQVDRLALITWLQGLPVTGRVALGIVDPRWLETHPAQDPVLSAGQQFVAGPPELKTIAVVRSNGELCHVRHEAGRSALDYAKACDLPAADWAWVAQPDGRTARVAVAPWNAQPSDEPAPGSWIWAAPRAMPDLVAASEGMIKFLATQGPSPQVLDAAALDAVAPAPAADKRAPLITSLDTRKGVDAAHYAPVRSVLPDPVPTPKVFRTSTNDWAKPASFKRLQPAWASSGTSGCRSPTSIPTHG